MPSLLIGLVDDYGAKIGKSFKKRLANRTFRLTDDVLSVVLRGESGGNDAIP